MDPPLFPLSLALSALLVAANFLDYSWCRSGLTPSQCWRDVQSSLFAYGLSGGIFLALFSVPVLNTLAPFYATVYYSVLFAWQKTPR